MILQICKIMKIPSVIKRLALNCSCHLESYLHLCKIYIFFVKWYGLYLAENTGNIGAGRNRTLV